MNDFKPSFFDEADRLARLSKLKDPLVELKKHIDFELFRPQLLGVFKKGKTTRHAPIAQQSDDNVY